MTHSAEGALAASRIIEDQIVPGGGYWSRILVRGQTLRIVDLEGCQAVDFICCNARDTTDRYSATNTVKMNSSTLIRTGTQLYSDECNVLMTVVGDTFGRHDTLCGSCNSGSNRVRYGVRRVQAAGTIFYVPLSHMVWDEGTWFRT